MIVMSSLSALFFLGGWLPPINFYLRAHITPQLRTHTQSFVPCLARLLALHSHLPLCR